MPKRNIRLLLVDDHDLVRTGMRSLLQQVDDVSVVGEARTGEEAVDFVRRESIDVVMMDINMPGMGGLEATRQILKIQSGARVIAVSMHQDGPLPGLLLQAGALGYITKAASVEELTRALHTVYDGRRYVSGEVAQKLVLNQYSGAANPIEQLSERELQVLMLIAKGHSVKQISERLFLSSKTVHTYRSRLCGKLNAVNDVDLTHIALRFGLIEPGGIEEEGAG